MGVFLGVEDGEDGGGWRALVGAERQANPT